MEKYEVLLYQTEFLFLLHSYIFAISKTFPENPISGNVFGKIRRNYYKRFLKYGFQEIFRKSFDFDVAYGMQHSAFRAVYPKKAHRQPLIPQYQFSKTAYPRNF